MPYPLPDAIGPGRNGASAIPCRRNRQVVGAILSATLCLAVATGCGGGTSASASAGGTPLYGGVLTFARQQEPLSLAPEVGTDTGSIFTVHQIFDQLVEVVPNSAAPAPALARSWTISKTGLVYTFHLRPGVRFSNGQLMTAQDVKYSLDGYMNPNIDTTFGGLTTTMKSVKVLGPETVQVRLSRLTASFLEYLAISAASIVPESVIRRIGPAAFGQHPVGTGPFLLTSWRHGQDMKLVRNPYYWGPKPYLAGVTYLWVPNDNSRILDVASGQAQAADGVPYSQVALLNRTSGAHVLVQKAYTNDWIFLNTTRPPLTDVTVRQALAYATPLQAIRRDVFFNLAPIANSANLPTQEWNSSLAPYPYDPGAARALLARSAAPHGFDITMQVTTGDSIASQLATILQQSWARIGVRLHVQQIDPGTMTTDLANFNYQAQNWQASQQVSDIASDDEFDGLVTAPGNNWPSVGWHDPSAAAAVARAIGTFNESQRRYWFAKYQEILKQQVPIIGVVFPPNVFVARDNVHNFVSVPEGWPVLQSVWLGH